MTKTICIHDKKVTLEEAQAAVDGYVERVRIKGGVMLVNEDGIAKHLEYNPVASTLAHGPILGDVLVLMGKARHGW